MADAMMVSASAIQPKTTSRMSFVPAKTRPNRTGMEAAEVVQAARVRCAFLLFVVVHAAAILCAVVRQLL